MNQLYEKIIYPEFTTISWNNYERKRKTHSFGYQLMKLLMWNREWWSILFSGFWLQANTANHMFWTSKKLIDAIHRLSHHLSTIHYLFCGPMESNIRTFYSLLQTQRPTWLPLSIHSNICIPTWFTWLVWHMEYTVYVNLYEKNFLF